MNPFLNSETESHPVLRCNDTGKIIYPMRVAAADALAKLKHASHRKDGIGKRIKHRNPKPAGKRIYYCVFCGGFHPTSWSWWPFETKHYLPNKQRNSKYETRFTI